jgi:hypothetical protein
MAAIVRESRASREGAVADYSAAQRAQYMKSTYEQCTVGVVQRLLRG